MTQCIDVNCWYHKEYGKNKICPISKEVHAKGHNAQRKAELKRLEKCFKIIRHELLRDVKTKNLDSFPFAHLSVLKEIREYMIY